MPFYSEKVARVGSGEGLPIPEYMAQLIQYFEEYVRPLLLGEDDEIESLFVNKEARPMGKFS
jgi:hypothetical protein